MKKTKILALVISIFLSFNSLAQERKVGINTTTPRQTLDVNGTLSVENLGDYTESSIPIHWNQETKQVVLGSTDINKPYYKIAYTITCAEQQLKIENFDTKIDGDKYTVIITNAFLLAPDGLANGENWGINHAKQTQTNDMPSIGFRNSSPQTLSFVETSIVDGVSAKSWRIKADYPLATPWLQNGNYNQPNRRFKWRIELLVINNSLIRTDNTQTGTIISDGNGSAVNSPI